MSDQRRTSNPNGWPARAQTRMVERTLIELELDETLSGHLTTFGGYLENIKPGQLPVYAPTRSARSRLWLLGIGIPLEMVDLEEYPNSAVFRLRVDENQTQPLVVIWAGVWPLQPPRDERLYGELVRVYDEGGRLEASIIGLEAADLLDEQFLAEKATQDLMAIWRILRLVRRQLLHPGGAPHLEDDPDPNAYWRVMADRAIARQGKPGVTWETNAGFLGVPESSLRRWVSRRLKELG